MGCLRVEFVYVISLQVYSIVILYMSVCNFVKSDDIHFSKERLSSLFCIMSLDVRRLDIDVLQSFR